MPKTTLNLTVDAAAVERGRRYGERHDVSISRLVSDFLLGLPLEDDAELDLKGPITRRLFGIAKGGPDEEDYHQHLLEKYSR
jgi:hypothetical protein